MHIVLLSKQKNNVITQSRHEIVCHVVTGNIFGYFWSPSAIPKWKKVSHSRDSLWGLLNHWAYAHVVCLHSALQKEQYILSPSNTMNICWALQNRCGTFPITMITISHLTCHHKQQKKWWRRKNYTSMWFGNMILYWMIWIVDRKILSTDFCVDLLFSKIILSFCNHCIHWWIRTN